MRLKKLAMIWIACLTIALTTSCTNTIEVEKIKIKCVGNIVTWDSKVDVISNETARLIAKNNMAYETCVSSVEK